jgi:thiamine biosynthesis lipoprotein
LIGGKRYSHTIDPRTGLPVTGVKSVTIICPNAEIADAMATPVMIMGARAGMDMINQINHLEGIIIGDDNKVYKSDHLRLINK